MQQRPPSFCLLPSCHRPPNRRQHPSVSLAASLECLGVSLQDTANPIRVIAELTHCLNRKRHFLAVLVNDAFPADHDHLQKIKLALLAQLLEFLPTHQLELRIKRRGIKRAAISGLFNRHRPSENLDFFTDKCHA